jgi:hypothetical protein
MTARDNVGSDFDLHQLIDHESRAETALDRLLVSDRLAGRMGERIAATPASGDVPASRSGAITSRSC